MLCHRLFESLIKDVNYRAIEAIVRLGLFSMHFSSSRYSIKVSDVLKCAANFLCILIGLGPQISSLL